MERKHIVFLTVLSVATLLVAVVGATFAYFSTSVISDFEGAGAATNNQASVSTAKLAASTITFRAKAGIEGNQIGLEHAIPGDSDEAVFEIANSGEVDIKYNIKWKSITNGFTGTVEGVTGEGHPEELVYTLKCTGGTTYTGTETQVPTDATGGAMTDTALTVKANQTAECTVKVLFKEIDAPQNYNQGRSFTGVIDVTTENITNN